MQKFQQNQIADVLSLTNVIKSFQSGYNNAVFDNKFFQQLFKRNDNPYFYSYFWGSIDLMILCNMYFSNYRQFLPNLKLKTAAKLLGVDVEEESLHNASYDVYLTTQIYFKLLKENKLQLQFSQKIKEKLLEN